MTEDNRSKAEAFAEKIKTILRKAVANRIIDRRTLTEIDAIKHDIHTLGFATNWEVNEERAQVTLMPLRQKPPHPSEKTTISEEEDARFEEIMNQYWRKDND